MRWFFDLNRYNDDDDDSDIIGLTYKVNETEITYTHITNKQANKSWCGQSVKMKEKSAKHIDELCAFILKYE